MQAVPVIRASEVVWVLQVSKSLLSSCCRHPSETRRIRLLQLCDRDSSKRDDLGLQGLLGFSQSGV